MIPTIVFSRDRACQLDLLLTSLEQNAPGMFDVTVLWTATNDAFMAGYIELLSVEHDATYTQETDFRSDAMRTAPAWGYVIFFTDDDVLYRRLPSWLRLDPDVFSFSLRLGHNTDFCYPHQAEQTKTNSKDRPPYVEWLWPASSGDFGYPASLDGHLMRGEDLDAMLGEWEFTNPNQMEDALARNVALVARPVMRSFTHSCLVGIPCNQVTQTHQTNRRGNNPDLTPEALNTRFLAGERIDLDAMDFGTIRGAHQEIPYVFKSS